MKIKYTQLTFCKYRDMFLVSILLESYIICPYRFRVCSTSQLKACTGNTAKTQHMLGIHQWPRHCWYCQCKLLSCCILLELGDAVLVCNWINSKFFALIDFYCPTHMLTDIRLIFWHLVLEFILFHFDGFTLY